MNIVIVSGELKPQRDPFLGVFISTLIYAEEMIIVDRFKVLGIDSVIEL